MEDTITATAKSLLAEMRKDISFFGACGALTGLLMVWQSRLQAIGVGKDTTFSMNLFSDFVSFSAFGLIFIGLVALGTMQTIFLRFGWHWKWLASTVAHLEGRLTQFASTIVCFIAGLLAIALLYSVLNLETGGARLAAIAIPFCFVIFAGHVAAIAIVRREPPFDKWWAALFFFVGVLVLLTVLILRGTGTGAGG
jgi:hypothetical protein